MKPIVLAEVKGEPCKRHKPKELGYLAWHNWAEEQIKKCEKQTRCKKCGRWYFKSEM